MKKQIKDFRIAAVDNDGVPEIEFKCPGCHRDVVVRLDWEGIECGCGARIEFELWMHLHWASGDPVPVPF